MIINNNATLFNLTLLLSSRTYFDEKSDIILYQH